VGGVTLYRWRDTIGGLTMGKIPKELRETIARNIRDCRLKKFPGRGGGKKCAEEFGFSPQQWSPWERAMRTPDEMRLTKIAEFFDVTVEWLRRDHRKPPPVTQDEVPIPTEPPPAGIGSPEAGSPFVGIAGVDVPPPPSWQPAPPGSAASFYWLARHFIRGLEMHGLRLDKQSLDYLASLMKKP
ncbi:MAG: helix-turn-helix domain-containing protein, partial [Planctomycetes bacterium]|nr:helix-turn-helix domain-containing protein [Planctomycetota bacterium]MCD7895346.1 helix-turn-helix domain-containing protein [Planctomycetaceae bacterium]